MKVGHRQAINLKGPTRSSRAFSFWPSCKRLSSSAPVSGIARQQRCTLTVVVVATATVAGVAAWRGRGGWALLVLGAPLIVYALVLAFEFVLGALIAGSGRPPVAEWLRAWAGEWWAASRSFCWRQPFCSTVRPNSRPEIPEQRRPGGGVPAVVLVHGFLCNRGVWSDWLERLAERGISFAAVDLEPALGAPEEWQRTIDDAMRSMRVATGRAPVVVAHSLGGVLVREWWQHRPDAAIAHLITLGSPHRGTWMARLALHSDLRRLRLGSNWLKELQAGEPPSRARRLTCFYAPCDNIVFPALMATHPGADNRPLHACGHVQMIDRPEPFDALLAVLEAAAGAASPGNRPTESRSSGGPTSR